MSDLIERSKAVDAIYWEVTEVNSKEMAENILSDVPTLDVEPVRHGHWERDVPWLIPTCSVCGENAIGLHAFDCKLTDYCPHCGAKMDEVEDGKND